MRARPFSRRVHANCSPPATISCDRVPRKSLYAIMAVQFTLSRMFQLVAVAAVLCSLFASLPWPTALVVLIVMNAIAALWFFAAGRLRTSNLACIASFLIMATLVLTDWGMYTYGRPPVVRVAWPPLFAACVFELATILDWFLFFHR